MAIPTSELQSISPSSIIDLFVLELVEGLHYPTGNPSNVPTNFRFHAGANMNSFSEIVWQGVSYQRFPINADGFKKSGRGQIPRPQLEMSNLGGITREGAVLTVTGLLTIVNQTTAHNDLLNAKLTRHRVLASSLDVVNFAPVITTTTVATQVVDPDDVETVTFTVTVGTDSNGDNVFIVNGTEKPTLTMKRGSTYIFDQSHLSNSNHPLNIKSDSGQVQTVTKAGTIGVDGTVTYSPLYPTAPNDVRYYCETHGNAMGAPITINNPNLIAGTTTQSTSTQSNPFGTPNSNELPLEVFYIDRKVQETREFVVFELVSKLDTENKRIPARQVTRDEFPAVGTFLN